MYETSLLYLKLACDQLHDYFHMGKSMNLNLINVELVNVYSFIHDIDKVSQHHNPVVCIDKMFYNNTSGSDLISKVLEFIWIYPWC